MEATKRDFVAYGNGRVNSAKGWIEMQKGQKDPWAEEKPKASSPVEGLGDYPTPPLPGGEANHLPPREHKGRQATEAQVGPTCSSTSARAAP
jgi:hypothetical protein